METTYNFFSGFTKFKFRLIFNYLIFVPAWVILLLFFWIGYMDFLAAFVLAGFIAFVIAILIAISKTPNIDCYFIGGRHYILYNPNIYYKKFFDMGEGSFILTKNKYIPENVYFINDFLDDFISDVKIKSRYVNEYFDAFKDIDIDNVNYLYVHSKYPKSEILKAFNGFCSIKINLIPQEDAISILRSFKEVINQGEPGLKMAQTNILSEFQNSDNPILRSKAAETLGDERFMRPGTQKSYSNVEVVIDEENEISDDDEYSTDGLTIEQRAFLQQHKNRISESEEKADAIYRKMTGR